MAARLARFLYRILLYGMKYVDREVYGQRRRQWQIIY